MAYLTLLARLASHMFLLIVSVKDSTNSTEMIYKDNRISKTNVGQLIAERHNNQIQTCYCALLQDFMKHGMVIDLDKRNV